jgi:predicted MPP superfamily phosphohydrolase
VNVGAARLQPLGGKEGAATVSQLQKAIAILFVAVLLTGQAFAAKPQLSFRPDGSFKIVQFSDTQDGPNIDPRTIAGMNTILDSEKPDLVVLTGDNIEGFACKTAEGVRQAIEDIALPMENRKIPWVMVFGNHDRESLDMQKITEEDMFNIYLTFPYNMNSRGPKDVYGIGNSVLTVKGSKSSKAGFAVWLLDSSAYPSGYDYHDTEIHGQKTGTYDYIHFTQIRWYWDTSVALEKRYHKKVPSLMFFHIPLIEFKDLSASGKFTGEKNEGECPGYLNSGLFAALLDRGDVKGVFCGHDHTNTYCGDWYGIKLGYDGSMGYGTYGDNKNRGGRVFIIDEKNPEEFKTSYVVDKK